MFLVRAWNWTKENLLLVGAILGSLATLALSLIYRRGDSSDITTTVLENKSNSNDDRAQKDKVIIAATEQFAKNLEKVKEEAKAAGEKISEEQEAALSRRMKDFASASTDEEKIEIAKDISQSFPFAKLVDASEFGEVK